MTDQHAGNGYERARTILAEALNLETAAIDAEASIMTLEAWDSLAHMRLIAAVEDDLAVQLEPDAIVSIASLADVVKIIEDHG